MSGLKVPCLGATPGAGGEGVGLVVDQQRSALTRESADAFEVAILRQDDADVGEGRFHEHGGHVAMSELALQPVEVVVLGHPAGNPDINRRTDVA